MLTVPEAAREVQRDPETIRRWIRSGRLPARKIGTQHVIEEEDLWAATTSNMRSLPPEWDRTWWGEPMPDVVAWVRGSRAGH
jgi:excisionase family DNA binding protein